MPLWTLWREERTPAVGGGQRGKGGWVGVGGGGVYIIIPLLGQILQIIPWLLLQLGRKRRTNKMQALGPTCLIPATYR